MPTKDFRADLREAGAPHRYPHLSQVKPGDYEGSISFNLQAANTNIEFQVVISDASDYPTDHSFGVFATSDNVPPPVTKALETAQNKGFFSGVSVNDLLVAIDRIVHDVLHNPPKGLDNDNDFDDSDQSMDDYEALSDGRIPEDVFDSPPQRSYQPRQKLQKDMRSVKNAGFKVGCLGETGGTLFVAVSRQISKLGISEEAMQAWNLEASEYLVLLIRYPNSYRNMQEIFDMGDAATNFIDMRVGLCDSYKPTFRTAVHAFQTTLESLAPDGDSPGRTNTESAIKFRALFIGSPLERLLNERLLGILRIRQMHGFTWTGAEFFFHARQGKAINRDETRDPRFLEPDSWISDPQSILAADHFREMKPNMTEVSFPLIAWQFTLRHFLRCTEFCLVCHCKTFDEFEALRPYVCSSSLCLYQYITYGMGTSLEYEIKSQPFVVDLLVSLAYARAKAGYLEDFPKGLGIRVPALNSQTLRTSKLKEGSLHIPTMTLFCKQMPTLAVGDWMVITENDDKNVAATRETRHCQVMHIDECLQAITVSQLGTSDKNLPLLGIEAFPERRDVRFVLYDQDFDDLTPQEKRISMTMILDTLPRIQSMKDYLGPDSSQTQKRLSLWCEKITPSALYMLRWIIASNRSCILQDSEDKNFLITEMQGYVQFRLAQGAPDKEERFFKAVKSVSLSSNPRHPTIFAWHGSPVYNWHSILREGLNFKQIANGRACGDGVYLSSNFKTSIGYSSQSPVGTGIATNCRWPQSELDIQSVVSLVEIVNKTDKFVSAAPHFVVKQLEWIQPRYLFVGTSKQLHFGPSVNAGGNVAVYEQEPSHKALGPSGNTIKIPLSAINSQRRRMIGLEPPGNASGAQFTSQNRLPEHIEPAVSPEISRKNRGNESVSTLTEDLNLLLSCSEAGSRVTADDFTQDCDEPTPTRPVTGTDNFRPGTLTEDSLNLLSPPQYATPSATKLLQRHLNATLKVQSQESLSALGWYVDPNLINTVYQWIVELHTFDSALPLSKDLKAVGMQSVVLEIRFPPQFPMDPPFVRIIRPRFLEFAHGGGGHVTAGGAMCMELLTNSGWSPVVSIESVLLQVRMAISSTEPRPGRLARGGQRDYSVNEAVQAFKRACLHHGWKVPSDMELISW